MPETHSRQANRRKFLKASVGAAAGLGLSGCTGEGDDTTTAGGDTTTSSDGNTTTTTGTASGTTTLKMMHGMYEQSHEVLRAILDEFENEHDVTIDDERVAFGDQVQKVAQAHVSGNPYDITIIGSPSQVVQAQDQGVIQPVNEAVEDLGGTDYFYENMYIRMEGDHYVVPLWGTVANLFYRNDIYEEYGANQPPFDNWDQYLQAAETTTNEDENLYGHPVFANIYFHGVWPMCLVLGNGGNLVDEDGNIAWDSPEVVETLEFIKQMDQYSPDSAHNVEFGDMRAPLYQGNYAMSWYSRNLVPSDTERYNPDLKGSIDITHIPSATADQEPVARTTTSGLNVSSETDNRELCIELAKHVCSPENVVRYLHSEPASATPAQKGILERDGFWENETLQDYEDMYRKLVDIQRNWGRPIAVMENEGVVNPLTGTILGSNMVTQSVQDVVINDMAPQESAEKWAGNMREEYGDS